MDKKAKLKSIIEQYEGGQIDIKRVLITITETTGKTISKDELDDYWRSTSLDQFCELLTTEPITEWQNIDDTTALSLIKEILNNITKDNIIYRNAEALEKRYNKPTGFISNLIFHSDLQNEAQLLELLKKNTTINL
jgi:DNA primase large subunit